VGGSPRLGAQNGLQPRKQRRRTDHPSRKQIHELNKDAFHVGKRSTSDVAACAAANRSALLTVDCRPRLHACAATRQIPWLLRVRLVHTQTAAFIPVGIL